MTTILDTTPRTARGQVRPGRLLATVLGGQFMALLDTSIVNVAGPTIRRDLHASGAGLQMVIAGYIISYAALLITGARLGDRFGHARMFRIGLVVFTLASLACGLAPNTAALIVFRLVQGGGAAVMVPQVMSLVQRTFTGTARARALSIYAGVISCGVILGQILGGLLVTANIAGAGWRPIFLVNVPIGVVMFVAAMRVLPADGERRDARGLDPAGLVTLATAAVLLVVPLVLGQDEHWPVWGWVSMAAAVVVFAVFLVVERRASAPLVPHEVLRAPGMLPAVVAIFLAMASFGGFFFAFALHLQSGLGYSAERAGLTFVPSGVCFAFSSYCWRYLPQRLHRPLISVGFVGAALSYAALSLSAGAGTPWVVLFTMTLGLSLGAAYSPIVTTALTYVDVRRAADASGLLLTAIQLGQVLGVAALGAVFLDTVHGPLLHGTVHPLTVTDVALTGVVLVAALASAFLPRAIRR